MGCVHPSKPVPPEKSSPPAQVAVPAQTAPAQASTPAIISSKPAVTPSAPKSRKTQNRPGKPSLITEAAMGKMTKIYIVTYSMYGHIGTMAKAIKDGIESVEGCEGIIYQVAETLPAEVLEKMHAPPKPDFPIITAAQLPEADGLVFGFPTRFGSMCAQMKALFDATGQLWQSGGLVGKPVTFFTSTACQGGGQETTIFTAVTQAAHHGMIYVPPGFGAGAVMFSNEEARGGSAWGAGCLANGDGSRQPSENELAIATYQGKYFAGKTKLLSA